MDITINEVRTAIKACEASIAAAVKVLKDKLQGTGINVEGVELIDLMHYKEPEPDGTPRGDMVTTAALTTSFR